MAAARWKSGSLVKLTSGSGTLEVIGYDSVGSVIGAGFARNKKARIYVTPSLLVRPDHKSAAQSASEV